MGWGSGQSPSASPSMNRSANDDSELFDKAINDIFEIYSSLSFAPPLSQYTVLASFFLLHHRTRKVKVLSVATGTKCLPTNKLSQRGEAIHDSHAEVLARRSALRWFFDEIARCCTDSSSYSEWILQNAEGRFALRDGVRLNLYVSTLPCESLPPPVIKSGLRALCRWRLLDAISGVHSGRGNGRSQRLRDATRVEHFCDCSGTRRLCSSRRVTHKTWSI